MRRGRLPHHHARPGRRRSSTLPSSTRAARVSASRASCCRRSPSSPTRTRIDRVPDQLAGVDRMAPRRPQPLPRPLVQRPRRRPARSTVPDHVVLPPALTGVESPIIVAVRRPLPDDHRPQGAGRLRLPGAAGRSPVSSTRPCHRAIWPSHRQLRPRRRRHQPDHGLPRRGRAARRACRRSASTGSTAGWPIRPTSSARRAARATSRRSTTPATSWPLDPGNVVLNQFCELGNHLAHLEVTGRGARARVRARRATSRPGLRLAAFVSATGSAGTIAAGDVLKERYGTRIVAVEALECPTMLENGFGEHNIQGIGDKHIPLIHNVMNTDVVVARQRPRHRRARRPVQHRRRARGYLVERHGVADADRGDALATSASRRSATCWPRSRRPSSSASARTTPSSPSPPTAPGLYDSERAKTIAARFGGEFTEVDAAEAFGEHLASVDDRPRARVHRAGPQPHLQPRLLHVGRAAGHAARGVRGPPIAARSGRTCGRYPAVWDELIDDFNARTGLA